MDGTSRVPFLLISNIVLKTLFEPDPLGVSFDPTALYSEIVRTVQIVIMPRVITPRAR